MSTLIVVGFKKDLSRASKVLNELIDLNYAWTIDLDDAVVAYRDYNGKLRIDSSYQPTTGEGAALGSLLGSLVGLTLGAIAAPVTAGASAAAATVVAAGALGGALGAAGGALDAKWWKDDFGIPDDFVQDVGALVQPGDSAIFALLRTADTALVAARFSDYGGTVLSTNLSPEQAKQVQAILNGKNNFKIADSSPQPDKEITMATWTEMESQIEPELRAWAQALDELDKEEAAAEAELDATIKAAQADEQAKLQAQSAKVHSNFEARRAKIQKDMNALSDKINAAADRLDADTDKAVGKAKSDLEAQQAKMCADREKLNAHLKASYESQVEHIETQLGQMKTWAQTTDEKTRAKVHAELDALRKQVASVKQHIQSLHAEHIATWNENKAKVERALADLKAGREKALAELEAGREKAKAEFKTTA